MGHFKGKYVGKMRQKLDKIVDKFGRKEKNA